MATAGLLKDKPNPTEEQIYKGLEGNLCRCTGYINIVKAVKRSAKLLRSKRWAIRVDYPSQLGHPRR